MERTLTKLQVHRKKLKSDTFIFFSPLLWEQSGFGIGQSAGSRDKRAVVSLVSIPARNISQGASISLRHQEQSLSSRL